MAQSEFNLCLSAMISPFWTPNSRAAPALWTGALGSRNLVLEVPGDSQHVSRKARIHPGGLVVDPEINCKAMYGSTDSHH
ncbi:hypothetical protein TcYC6_0001030 [Trypanosoma cruzi]|nr:hypothetical protein TcYC6_0001030 [Trypanosoma cruzi]